MKLLSAELTDHIIDQLDDSKLALAACSLVSRKWVPRSRFHLFRSIYHQPETNECGFEPFLIFLRSHANLAGLIHNLELNGSVRSEDRSIDSDSNNDFDAWGMGPCLEITYPIFFHILNYLPKLSTLALRHLRFEGLNGIDHSHVRPVAIARLTLENIRGSDDSLSGPSRLRINTEEFKGILAAFSSIRELRARRLKFDSDTTYGDATSSSMDLLHGQLHPLSLVLDDCYLAEILYNAICHIPIGSLLMKSSGEELNEVWDLIEDAGPVLRYLEFDIIEGSYPPSKLNVG